METNYYAEFGCCKECGIPKKRLHIGKLSGGWEFSFRGHRDHSPPLASLEDWRHLLTTESPRIVDEYGAIEESAERFFTWVEGTKGGRNQTDYVRNNSAFGGSDYWKDQAGWSFNGQDFS